jgi:hypothetical protein
MSTEALPPWGRMEARIEDELKKRPIPEAWRVTSHGSPKDEFIKWRDLLIDELAELLWPTYDEENHCWSRPPSQALLEADFALLKELHHHLSRPVNGLGTPPTTHREFFDEEDDVNKIFGVQYERYDPALPQYLRAGTTFTDILWYGCDRKLASLTYQLKGRFQRPRAFQVALVLGRKHDYVWARTGGTPSFVSGHCLQGSLAGSSAFVLFGRDIDLVSVEILKQFTVDIGDRRVFAGVHYPSDNLSSWYTALKLLPHVLNESQVQSTCEFLWSAISTKSIVYRAIRGHAEINRDSPYWPCIRALERVAGETHSDP